jgi:hypothetical protein
MEMSIWSVKNNFISREEAISWERCKQEVFVLVILRAKKHFPFVSVWLEQLVQLVSFFVS